MSFTLTPDQQKTVNAKRKPDGQRPQIFNRLTGTNQEISADFEAFIILADQSTKLGACNWIAALSTFKDLNIDKQDLLGQCLTNEFNTTSDRTGQLSSDLAPYETFANSIKSTLAKGGQSIPEVQTLLTDSAFILGDLTEKLERSVNQQILNQLVKSLYADNSFSGMLQELQSMVPVLLSY